MHGTTVKKETLHPVYILELVKSASLFIPGLWNSNTTGNQILFT